MFELWIFALPSVLRSARHGLDRRKRSTLCQTAIKFEAFEMLDWRRERVAVRDNFVRRRDVLVEGDAECVSNVGRICVSFRSNCSREVAEAFESTSFWTKWRKNERYLSSSRADEQRDRESISLDGYAWASNNVTPEGRERERERERARRAYCSLEPCNYFGDITTNDYLEKEERKYVHHLIRLISINDENER